MLSLGGRAPVRPPSKYAPDYCAWPVLMQDAAEHTWKIGLQVTRYIMVSGSIGGMPKRPIDALEMNSFDIICASFYRLRFCLNVRVKCIDYATCNLYFYRSNAQDIMTLIVLVMTD